MRILIMPHTGLRKIHGDSNYLLFIDLARYLIGRGHFCYMVMPEYARESVDRFPGLMYAFKEYKYDFYTEYTMIDLRQLMSNFSRMVGRYPVDAIVTAMSPQVPIYQLALTDNQHQRDIPVVTIDPGVWEDEKDSMVIRRMWSTLHCLGHACSRAFFLGPHQKEIALKNARVHLAPYDVKRLDENSQLLAVGVLCDYIDDLRAQHTKYDKFTLFYGGRMNTIKNPGKIFALYDKFMASGRSVQVKVTTNTTRIKFQTMTGSDELLRRSTDAFDIRFGCPRDEYMKIACRSHVAIAWSESEGFPVGFWEQMYMGLPMLFWDRPWVRAQIPEWYPWVFQGTQQAYAMLSWIYDNYAEAQQVMERMRAYIRERYHSNRIHEQIESTLHEIVYEPENYKSIRPIKALLQECMKLLTPGQKVTVAYMCDLMSQVGTSFPKDSMQRAGIAKFSRDYEIYRMMRDELGFVDTHRTPVPVLIAPDTCGR